MGNRHIGQSALRRSFERGRDALRGRSSASYGDANWMSNQALRLNVSVLEIRTERTADFRRCRRIDIARFE